MERLGKQLTFEGGVNLDVDPHLLKSNEWLSLQNMWPYRAKLLGSRPSLLHENDILPVPLANWDGRLFTTYPTNPTNVRHYAQWFRHLTPLKALFLGSIDRLALICVCNYDGVEIYEHFEGEEATTVTLTAGEVILMLTPNDLQTGTLYPKIAAVRLGRVDNITPSLVQFNGSLIAANKGCEYVVQVVKSNTLPLPSATIWPNIDYRFTKVNFGETNLNFRVDGVIVYKNRFVYWRANKVWFSDPFQPGLIYDNAVDTAYLGVFFDTEITEDITAMTDLYTSSLEEAGSSVLAVWTPHSMLMVQGEPATTIASTAEEAFAACKVTRVGIKSGCISQSSIVKTKLGIIWCGSESVWFMAKGNLPVEVGAKIRPRIQAQAFESAGRIFATYDDMCYRLVINNPSVGFNQYEALNEMWCLSFIGDVPNESNAAWFGPQVFANTDNPIIGETPGAGGEPGLFCCAKMTNVNDDKTWYIQPYSMNVGQANDETDFWGTRLGLASISTYLGVDITAPFRQIAPIDYTYYYDIGATFQMATGDAGVNVPYVTELVVTTAGLFSGGLQYTPIYINELAEFLYAKRPLFIWEEVYGNVPVPYKIMIQSANLTFDNPELLKLIDGYELTFKTLNPVMLSTWWWPWEPGWNPANIVTLESKVNVPVTAQNQLGGGFNEPILTARRIPAPADKRYNGLTAQLNLTDADYKIVASDNGILNPEWNKIRISTDNLTWLTFDLFDFDVNGIAKYATLTELMTVLQQKVLDQTGFNLIFSTPSPAGTGVRFLDEITSLFIDLTAQGWEWFGFIPTGRNFAGAGVNIVSNEGAQEQFIYPTGPVPCGTPHEIHFAKLSVRYSILEARPR